MCVTFFPTGAMAQTTQGQRVMAIIKAHPELFEVGNHTMHHCDLVKGGGGSPTTAPCAGGTPSADFIRKSIVNPNAEIAAGYKANVMPGNFSELLSDQQLKSLVDYLTKTAGKG